MHHQNITTGNTENRRVQDRRVAGSALPAGQKERRISVEKRQPDVAESSFEDWEALMGQNYSANFPSSHNETFLSDRDDFKHL